MERINYSDYYAKVRGGWLGKGIAGNMGGPLEDCRMIMDFKGPEEFSPQQMFANDDLDVQLVWMDVILEKGMAFNSDDLMEAFIKCYPYSPNEYGYSKRNYLRGVHPPLSGVYANDFFKYSMGCPIRAEVWGMIFPGNPGKAAEYAYKDGCLDHGDESIYAEQFIAAMEALAFVKDDIRSLIKEGLQYIPQKSCIHRTILWCVEMYEQGLPWKEAVSLLHTECGTNDSSAVFYNLGVEMLALLYGNGDFDATVTYAVNGGYDTDCTAATVGAILGIIYTEKVINKKWLDMAGEEIVTECKNLKHGVQTLEQLVETTCMIGLNNIRAGISGICIDNCPEIIPILPLEHPDISFDVDYNGLPELVLGGEKTVTVLIYNHTSEDMTTTIHIDMPSGIRMDKITETIHIPSRGNADVACRFYSNMEQRVFNEANIISLSLKNNETGREYKYSFGLVYTPAWRVLGPFWNPYDFKNVSREQRIAEKAYYNIPSRNIFRYYDLAEAHNNFIYLDEEYITEQFGKQEFDELFRKGVLYAASEDELSIDKMFGFKGSCCVYAMQKLFLDRAEQVLFFTGSTTPFKMWINEKLVYTQPDSNSCSPYTDLFTADLCEGENRIVVKLLRYSEGQRFTIVMRNFPYQFGHLIKTDIGYIIE